MKKNIKSRWWEFRIPGQDINSQLPLCYESRAIYVEWYASTDFLQGWLQFSTPTVCPTRCVNKSYAVEYSKLKYKDICSKYPLSGCVRHTLGQFLPKKQRVYVNKKIKKAYVPRRVAKRSRAVPGAAFFSVGFVALPTFNCAWCGSDLRGAYNPPEVLSP